MSRLAGRQVLLTGATGGIGAALAQALSAAGAQLRLHGRDDQRMQTLQASLPAGTRNLLGDLREAPARAELIEFASSPEPVDIAILNAASGHFGAFESMDEEQIERLLHTDLLVPMLLARRLLPVLRRRPGGLLVLVGSTLGQIGHPGYAVYGAAKAGLRSFGEALMRELGEDGPCLLTVMPRATRTAMNEGRAAAMNRALGAAVDPPERVAARIVAAIQAGRRRCQIGWPEALFTRVNVLAPGLVDRAMASRLPTIRLHLPPQGAATDAS